MLVYDAVLADPALQEEVAFRCEGGVCRPLTDPIRTILEGLQISINRAAAALGIGAAPVPLDAEIGTATAGRVREIWVLARGWVSVPTTSDVTQTDLLSALSLGSPNLVAKYAVPVASYMERVVTETYAIDPESVYRVTEYDRERAAGADITVAPPAPPAPPPARSPGRSHSRAPWIIGGVGLALAATLTTAAVIVSRRQRHARPRRRA